MKSPVSAIVFVVYDDGSHKIASVVAVDGRIAITADPIEDNPSMSREF